MENDKLDRLHDLMEDVKIIEEMGRQPKPFKFKFEIEGELMAQQSASFTVVVNPSQSTGNPLILTPSSGSLPAETEGVADAGDIVTVVSGGQPPYQYENVAGLPPGMGLSVTTDPTTQNDTVEITGTPNAGDAAGSPYTISFDVVDSATPAASASFRAPVGGRAAAAKRRL